MENWDDLLHKMFARYHAKTGKKMILPPPFSLSSIASFKKHSGYLWTDEFFEFYACHDGVGFLLPSTNKIIWSFVPTDKIIDFGTSIRDCFAATHPQIATAYHPFFDWMSGDAVGYLDLHGIVPGTLFEFQHECYEFDPAQHWSDFLKPVCSSIKSFLEV